jgi:hypothetical protein
LVQADFKPEIIHPRIAAYTGYSQQASNDLNFQHSHFTAGPDWTEPAAIAPVAGECRRFAWEFQRTVVVDNGPRVGQFRIVGNDLSNESIKTLDRTV